jgi:hypothetical protein
LDWFFNSFHSVLALGALETVFAGAGEARYTVLAGPAIPARVAQTLVGVDSAVDTTETRGTGAAEAIDEVQTFRAI